MDITELENFLDPTLNNTIRGTNPKIHLHINEELSWTIIGIVPGVGKKIFNASTSLGQRVSFSFIENGLGVRFRCRISSDDKNDYSIEQVRVLTQNNKDETLFVYRSGDYIPQ
jgi:hypothetical protein